MSVGRVATCGFKWYTAKAAAFVSYFKNHLGKGGLVWLAWKKQFPSFVCKISKGIVKATGFYCDSEAEKNPNTSGQEKVTP